MSEQKKCPVCEEISFHSQDQCPKCAWDLKAYYLTEEGIFNEQQTKIKWAKQMWHTYRELIEAYNIQKDNILSQEKNISKLEEEIMNLNNTKINNKIVDIRLSRALPWTKNIELVNDIQNQYDEYINIKFFKKLFYVCNSSSGWWLIADDPEDALSVSMRQTTTRNANNLFFGRFQMLRVYQFWKTLISIYSKYENFLDCMYLDLDCLYSNEDNKKQGIMIEGSYMSDFKDIESIVLPKYGLFKLLINDSLFSSRIVECVQTKDEPGYRWK
jgi:hypothetical protein